MRFGEHVFVAGDTSTSIAWPQTETDAAPAPKAIPAPKPATIANVRAQRATGATDGKEWRHQRNQRSHRRRARKAAMWSQNTAGKAAEQQ